MEALCIEHQINPIKVDWQPLGQWIDFCENNEGGKCCRVVSSVVKAKNQAMDGIKDNFEYKQMKNVSYF